MKPQPLTDVHLHLQNELFSKDLPAVLQRSLEQGIQRFICCATKPSDWYRVLEIGKENPSVQIAFGIHPWFVHQVQGDWLEYLEVLVTRQKLAGKLPPAIGEIGLDNAMKQKQPDLQEDFLLKQLELAHRFRRPVFIHSVQAADRIADLLSQFSDIPLILMHSFNGTKNQIQRFLKYNTFFSVSGQILNKNQKKLIQSAQDIPVDRLLLESDSPDMLPPREYFDSKQNPYLILEKSPNGYLRNEPSILPMILDELSVLKQISKNLLWEQIQANEENFFDAWKLA